MKCERCSRGKTARAVLIDKVRYYVCLKCYFAVEPYDRLGDEDRELYQELKRPPRNSKGQFVKGEAR